MKKIVFDRVFESRPLTIEGHLREQESERKRKIPTSIQTG